MRRYITPLLLLALLMLCIAGCGGRKHNENAAAPEQNTLAQNGEIQSADVTYLEYSNGERTLRFRLEETGWRWSDEPTFPLDGSYVEEFLSWLPELAKLEPVREVVDYGLEEPKQYVTFTAGEKTTMLSIGNRAEEAGYWYFSVDGYEGVYPAPEEFMALLSRSIYDMARPPELPTLSEDKLLSFTAQSGEKQIYFFHDESGWHCLNKAALRVVEPLCEALATLKTEKCFDYLPSEEAVSLCGFDAPSGVFTVRYINSVELETELVLTVGAQRDDGSYCVMLGADHTAIYLMSKEMLTPMLNALYYAK